MKLGGYYFVSARLCVEDAARSERLDGAGRDTRNDFGEALH
jgi:hypothetical protein